jgi:hypothetical protein
MKFNRFSAFTLGVVFTAVSIGAVSFVNAASDKTLKACANKTTGQMRYLTKGLCKKTETSLSWSQMGPQGVAGTKGETGVAGANGTNATLAITQQSVCDGVDANTIANEVCKVGMTGPGGGLIFFVDYNDQYSGLDYLEAAPMGWGNGIAINRGGATNETTGTAILDPMFKWCSDTTTPLGLDSWANSAVGAGATNTATADTTCAGGAIQAAADYVGGSKTDWFLPSLGEAMLMYTNLRQAGSGGFNANFYWSSSEATSDTALFQNFVGDDQEPTFKSSTLYVRPVRSF